MRLIGLAGWSGAGKTTLIATVIPLLRSRGVSVSTIKHAHHAFDIDTPGKDSFLHRQAGASEVIVASRLRFALMREHRGEPEPSLDDLLGRLAPVDLVLVEGFRGGSHPKLEVHRLATGKALIHPGDAKILAIATDAPGPFAIPRLDIADGPAIADFLFAAAEPVA